MIPRIIAWLQRHLPNACLLCLASTHSALALCQACIDDLPWRLGHTCPRCALSLNEPTHCGRCLKHPPSFDHSWCAWQYQAPIDHFVHQLKFSQQLIYAQLMGRLMAERLRQQQHPWPEAIIPVPLHRKRLRERGFNQAAEIARHMAKTLKLRYEPRLVERHKATTQQAQLPAAERKQNVRDAFRVKSSIPYQHVALVDDVMTTGTTLNELAKVLKNYGVIRVDVLCAARAEKKRRR